jgi:hypothetical protein
MKKADNFNPGQWLIENKLTNGSKLLNENKTLGGDDLLKFLEDHKQEVVDKLFKGDTVDDVTMEYLQRKSADIGTAAESFDYEFGIYKNKPVDVVQLGDEESETGLSRGAHIRSEPLSLSKQEINREGEGYILNDTPEIIIGGRKLYYYLFDI